jgi:hypothetical protein
LLIAATGSTAAFAVDTPGAKAEVRTTNLTVTEDNLQGWAHQAYDKVNYLDSNQQFVAGPGTPPLGGGSLKMSLSSADNSNRVELFRTELYDGTKIRDLRTLTYSTYSRANVGNDTPQQPAYLRLSVDTNGDADGGTQDTLFFYPANNGEPAQGKWQTWDAGFTTGDWTAVGAPATEFTLEQYSATHPDATIVENEDPSDLSQVDGGVALMVGGSGLSTQMDGEYFLNVINIGRVDPAADSVELRTRYDLEPPQPSVSIGDAQVSEGNSGATLTFPVTVANPTAKAVKLEYNTVKGTALPGSDYKAVYSAVTIGAGKTTGTITVPVISDTVNEPTETLTVKATAPGYGTMADGTATGTIIDDDPVVVTPPVVTPPVATPPVATAVDADLVVKGSGHKAGKDDIVANAIGKAAGAKVKLFRQTRTGKFRKIATGRLNSKGNHRFKNIADKNGNKRTTYKVKISSTDLTEKDTGRTSLR